MPELLPGEASQPTQEQGQDALPGLRLRRSPGPALPLALLVAATSGAAIAFALPPLRWWPLAYVAPAPLLYLVRRASPWRGALLGAVFGVASFGLLLLWLTRFGILAWGALVVVSAAWVALFGSIAPSLWREERPGLSVMALASAWTVIEWARASWPLGGFSWGQLGTTQVPAPLLRLASVTGVWGVSFAVMTIAGLLCLAWDRWGSGPTRTIRPLAAALAVAVLPLAVPLPSAAGRPIDVATIQVDVDAARGLAGNQEDIAVARMNESMHATLALDPADLVVWGEGALDPGASGDPATMSAIRRTIATVGAPTLIGAVVDDAGGRQRTSTLAFDGEGTLVGRYDKVHLVPFGEYVPWRSLLEGRISAIEQIPVDRVPGDDPSPLQVEGLPPIGTPICFENSFPDIERTMVRRGAQLIVLTINNASYGRSPASEQHLVMSRVRAVEDGRWVVHAAISGISAVIDPAGRVVAQRGLFEPAIMRATVNASTATTPYVRFGDWVVWTSALVALGAFAMPRRRTAAPRTPAPLRADPRVLVVLPTYNEKDTIADVLEGLLALDRRLEAVVVDDGSPDGTAAIVREVAARDARVSLIERSAKGGLASAYRRGFERAIAEAVDVVVEMDSDLSHRPDELPRLLSAIRDHHVVIGSRYVPGGSVTDWGPGRVALSRAGNRYARLALGISIRDATSGFRAYRTDALAEITRTPVRADGYGFQIELAYRAVRAGLSVGEVPITFSERTHGTSKISRTIVLEALWRVTVWGLRQRLGIGAGA